MPSPRILDLSPIPNEMGRQFGENFAGGFQRAQDRRWFDEAVGEEADPYLQLQKMRQSKHPFSPEFSKERRRELFEDMDARMARGREDREIARRKREEGRENILWGREDEGYARRINRENALWDFEDLERARLHPRQDRAENLNYITSLYGNKYKNDVSTLDKYIKENPIPDEQVLAQLRQNAADSYNEYSSMLRANAPPGLVDPRLASSVETGVAQPSQPMVSSNAPTSLSPVPSTQSAISKATPETLSRYGDVLRREVEAGRRTRDQLKKDAKRLVEEAYPYEVPAKKERLAREFETGKEVRPTKEEVVQLKDQDEKNKKRREKLDKDIDKVLANKGIPLWHSESQIEGFIDDLMELYKLQEEDALVELLSRAEFPNVPDEEQEDIFSRHSEWKDSQREAVVATILDLIKMENRAKRGFKR